MTGGEGRDITQVVRVAICVQRPYPTPPSCRLVCNAAEHRAAPDRVPLAGPALKRLVLRELTRQ